MLLALLFELLGGTAGRRGDVVLGAVLLGVVGGRAAAAGRGALGLGARVGRGGPFFGWDLALGRVLTCELVLTRALVFLGPSGSGRGRSRGRDGGLIVAAAAGEREPAERRSEDRDGGDPSQARPDHEPPSRAAWRRPQ